MREKTVQRGNGFRAHRFVKTQPRWRETPKALNRGRPFRVTASDLVGHEASWLARSAMAEVIDGAPVDTYEILR
jgi:hypothetical protein